MVKSILILLISLLVHFDSFPQKSLEKFKKQSNIEWLSDSINSNIIIYYEANSYAFEHLSKLKERILFHFQSTLEFIGLEEYKYPIHYFIIDNRQKMKMLLGYETNGHANPKNNTVIAIYSEKIKSVYSNHELFHLISMKEWAYPKKWINEGMAVYSDGNWQGYDLHQLVKYLIDQDKYVSIKIISKKPGKYESNITYPLLGSFVKFIDQTQGRRIIQLIWKNDLKEMKNEIGKNISELENEWLKMLDSLSYKDILYLK